MRNIYLIKYLLVYEIIYNLLTIKIRFLILKVTNLTKNYFFLSLNTFYMLFI